MNLDIIREGDVDTCFIMLRFANGVLDVIDNSRQAVYDFDQRIEVFSSKSCITADNEPANNTVLYNAQGVSSEKPLCFFLERYSVAFIEEARGFVNACLEYRERFVGAYDGFEQVKVAIAAKKR